MLNENATSEKPGCWSVEDIGIDVSSESDTPARAAAVIVERSEVPVLFSGYDELDHPAMKALAVALTEPISDEAGRMATTSFEELRAGKPPTISNAFVRESRAGRS